jgi:hypothetical protein
MARRIGKLKSYENPSVLDTTKIRAIGNVIPDLGKRKLQQLVPRAVMGALDALRKARFKKDGARILTESMIKDGQINVRDKCKQFAFNVNAVDETKCENARCMYINSTTLPTA